MLKKLLCVLAVAIVHHTYAQHTRSNKVWFTQPADATAKDNPYSWDNEAEWLKALPIGNGHLGAMVFGDVGQERLQLNELTLWSGSMDEGDNPDASKSLAQIRQLLFEGKYKEATELTNKTQVTSGKGSGHANGAKLPFGCFQTLGDLRLNFATQAAYTNYYRELDLMSGIALTRFTQNGISYTREVFASHPAQAIVIRLTASKPKSISLGVSIDRPERFTTTAKDARITMQGTLDNGKGGDGMKYKVQVIPVITDGTITTNAQTLDIQHASAVTIVLTAKTNYKQQYPQYINDEFESVLDSITHKAVSQKYAALKKAHINDFGGFMKRVNFSLNDAQNQLPTDELMKKNYETKNEQALYPLYFQFGRYLLLSSSRAGGLPANLQGIWANKIQTPWNGDYHTDINVQMNYWPAEVTNLSESHIPLMDLIASLAQPGKKTARIQYNMNGWVLHPITNVWGYTSPGEHASWGMHIGAGAWILQHVWEHYSFTKDRQFLRNAFPMLKEACLFYLDWLVKDPKTGKLVSGPSPSPENSFKAPDGSIAQISMGPSHDQQVIFELFTNTLKSAGILGIQDQAFTSRVEKALSELARPAIGADGRLLEWGEAFEETELLHRHLSHLYALFPGNEITLHKNPRLAEAVKKSLEIRGDGGVGWTYAWKIALWARLQDGDRALRILNDQLRPTYATDTRYNDGGGTYYNLFDACPPFQIDGNFGVVAGMAELLLQSHEDFIELLPALPKAWANGRISGLVARGNFVVDMEWKNGKLQKANIVSRVGGDCTVKYGSKSVNLKLIPGQRVSLSSYLSRKLFEKT